MIQNQTKLKVADNSGAKEIQVIRVTGGGSRRYGQIGDVVVASVKRAEPRRQVKKKDVVQAVIVRQRKPYRRKDGSYISFDDNAAVILEGTLPRGGRIFGPIPREIKQRGFNKIASLSQELL